MTALKSAVALAKKERKTKGRVRYSNELKAALKIAAKATSKSQLAKATGISYPTILRIVGTKKRRNAAPKTGTPTSLEINVTLPSNTTLRYSSLQELKSDAVALKNAAGV